MRLDVGIGEYKVSNNIEDIIKTYALGSCVAVIMYDRFRKVAGMIHVALPDSNLNLQKAGMLPGYFVNSGLPVLLKEMQKKGAILKKTWIKITGGSNLMDSDNRFDIGRRNVAAIKRHLWKNGFGVIKQDTGGKISRTVSVVVNTGEVRICNSHKKWLL